MFKQSLQYVLQACAITDCADTFDRERARSRSLGEETSMKANSDKSKQSQSNNATRRVLAGVLCGASVLSLVLSLVMPPISQAIANDDQTVFAEETVMGGGSSSESTDVDNTNNGDTENQNSDEIEGGASEDAAAAGLPSDDTKVEGDTQPSDAQPADDDNNDENAPATVSADDYTKVNGDVAKAFTDGGKFQLTGPAHSNQQIDIKKDTTIDLNGSMLYHGPGSVESFIVVQDNATLTIEDSAKVNDATSPVTNNPGQPAEMKWTGNNNGTPQSLTYYETTSTPNEDELGTTETTTKHVVSGFGAIVAASDGGSVKRVISVADGSTLNLNGGMITTPRTLGNDGHVILSQGAVNISGGYVTNGNGGGWGGGLCITGAKASLEMTDGVVAGNKAASGGGIFANNGATLKLAGGIISGNATYSDSVGLGGGILVSGGSVTVSGGYITNNKYAKFCGEDGQGGHGGAGLAANNGAHVTISGGQITGNYSEEAGGGVYVTNIFQHDRAWLDIKGGIIAFNVSYRSEGAGIRVGQMIDAMISGASKDSPVYITNNHCMSRFDWGGGGIFVQGDSNVAASNAGRLFVYNSYISANTAGGYGGGVAVCPTGKTLVTNTEGTAIFGNSSAGEEHDDNHFNNENVYNKEKNTGNEAKPHLSGGGGEKTEDRDAYGSEVFRKRGHADFFLAAKKGHTDPIAAVIGKMLGGGDAQYSGSKELKEAIDIPANGGVQIYQSIGLTSGVQAGSDEATAAQKAATTFITGNYSWDHGGGIMSNGDLYLGQPADTYVYPSLKLKATKKLIDSQTNKNKTLTGNEFTFTVYRKDSKDPFVNGKFNRDACAEVGTANNDASGNITFKLGEQFAASGTADEITYYLVEDTGEDSDITYDSAVYEIVASVRDTKTELMTVPTKENPNRQIPLNIHNYTIENVSVTKHELDKSSGVWSVTNSWDNVQNRDGYYPIACEDSSVTFTNEYTPYNSYGSWTPKATKVVKGGEMKEFTLEFADNEEFEGNNVRTVKTDATRGATQTLPFLNDSNEGIKYSLSDITKDPYTPGDSTGRGASKTFTYYVHEKDESSPLSHYKYDKSVYRFDVTMTDQKNRSIVATRVTYTQIKDADGEKIDPNKQVPVNFDGTKPTSTPTFTNTYSTSLPLSGMSGVTLTYLAGAAVLCAAAAWMHIRRKANAKGGERRE